MQKAASTVRFETNEKVKEAAERERRARLDQLEAEKTKEVDRELREEGQAGQREPSPEEAVQNSEEYRALQQRLRILDFVFFSIIFAVILYFCWDFCKAILKL